MQPEELEKIKKLIETSFILTDTERGQWLELLDLMNDKQRSELEQLLIVKPVAHAPQTHAAPFKASPGSLSHITNVPLDVDFNEQLSKSYASSPANISKTISTNVFIAQPSIAKTHQPALRPPPPPKTSAQVATALTPQTQVPAPKLPSTNLGVKPVHEDKFPTITSPTNFVTPKELEQITTLSDVGHLSLTLLRKVGFMALLVTLQKFARKSGYFDVLINFEQSPLYKQYVETGTVLLEHPTKQVDVKTMLSKNEFEGMTDLLQKLQMNN